jgi:DNA topoisomerase-1
MSLHGTPLEKTVPAPRTAVRSLKRRARAGLFGCANYPACDFTSWKARSRNLPQLWGLLVMANKRQVQCTKCENIYSLEEISPEIARE